MGQNRSDTRGQKKDQQVQREVLEDIGNETRPGERAEPHYRDANRDQSRGDWDRSRRHHDEDVGGA